MVLIAVEGEEIKMTSLLDEFLHHVKRTRKGGTHEFYTSTLVPLQRWLEGRGKSLETCTENDVHDYLDQARVKVLKGKKKWEISSKNACITALKRFTRWYAKRIPIGVTLEEVRSTLAAQQRAMQIQTMDRFRGPKRGHKKAFTLDQVTKLLHATKSKPKYFDRIYMLAYLGLRKGELSRITEVDLRRRRMVVLTEKTDVPRTLYFNDTVAEILKRHPNGFKEHPETYNAMLKKYTKLVGFRPLPKMFRATFETEMQRAVQGHLMREAKTESDLRLLPVRVDLLVKTMMGHTTEAEISGVYTEVGEEDIHRAMTEWHFMLGVNY